MSAPRNRVGYIDAMRGFTMILVVFSHIYIPNDTPLNMLLSMFRMPLFFFVSGFISYRTGQQWDRENYRHRLTEKVRTLLLPALIFGLLYCWAIGSDIGSFVGSRLKLGYWFTISLFEMLALYYTVRYIVYCRANNPKRCRAVLCQATLIAVVLIVTGVILHIDWNEVLCFAKTTQYLHFFALGLLCSYMRDRFFALLDSRHYWLLLLLFILFAVLYILALVRVNADVASVPGCVVALLGGWMQYVVSTVGALLGIVAVFGLFRRMRSLFSAERRFSPLQYVGRHTLEVYMLHYFLLIGFPSQLRPYVVDDPNILVQIVVGMSVSVLVTALSLLIGKILSYNRYMHYYALGARGRMAPR